MIAKNLACIHGDVLSVTIIFGRNELGEDTLNSERGCLSFISH